MTTRNGNCFEPGTGRIVGVVACVPKNIVTNDGWLNGIEAQKITGVRERRWAVLDAEKNQQTSEYLCANAAKELLTQIGWDCRTVTALIYVTQTPPRPMPAPAFNIHKALDLDQSCDVIQVNESCAGYVKGLKLAQKLATSDGARVLLLVGDTTSEICDPDDRATAPLFGDAGSATAIEFDPMASDFFITGCDGAGNHKLSQENPGFLHMDGAAVFNFTLKRVPGLVEDMLALTPRPDVLLFHQANAFMLDHLVKKTKLLESFAREQIPTNLEHFGNCSSASIPLLMTDTFRAETLAHPFERFAMIGFGAGWSWGVASVNITSVRVCKLIEV